VYTGTFFQWEQCKIFTQKITVLTDKKYLKEKTGKTNFFTKFAQICVLRPENRLIRLLTYGIDFLPVEEIFEAARRKSAKRH
jgi:hypothetical protein